MSLKSFGLAIAATAVLAGHSFAEEVDAELEAVRAKVDGMFEMIGPEDVKPSPVDGWYTIHKGSIVAYISGDGRYLLQGDLIDLDMQTNLTETVRNESRRDLMATVTNENSIVFSPAEVKHSIAIFTDIDCTYCRRLHAQIDQYLALGIEVRYLMYPRSGPATMSWNKAEDVWCSADQQNALTQAKLDRNFETAECDASMIEDHWAMGQDVGLSGTPAIVLEDGTLIAGYLAPEQLFATLESYAARQ